MASRVSAPFRSGPGRKLNLLVPAPSIHNTLRPDGSYRKTSSGRRPIAWIIFSMAVTATIYLAVFYFNAPNMDVSSLGGVFFTPPSIPDVAVVNTPAPHEAPKPAPTPYKPDTSPPHADEKDVKPPVPAQTPQTKEPSAEPEVKPDETKHEQAVPDPLLARPVAKDAAPSPKPKGVEAPPPSGKWAVRFGLCVYKANCDRIIEDMAHKGISAFIAEGNAEVMIYKVMVGPFPTQTHAKAAGEKFQAKKLELSPFAVDDQYYLGAATFIDPKTQDTIIETAKSFGYQAEGVSGKESRKVYKVYRNVMFDTKQAAEKALRYHKEQGLACIIERQD